MLKSVPKKVPQGARLSEGGDVMRKGLHFVELRTLDGKIFSNLFCWAQCGKSKK